jgi:hypothetical protein
MSLKCVLGHLRTCLNHPTHKQSQPFQSQKMWVLNEKVNHQNKWIGKHNGHSK